ncbi:hypothetical protein [Pseudofrankia saprophytica]|uniref:hypothetical protein n=1 Tax=Pseudofrankia saprophytica TaxID=298655 RepID=UPI000234CD7F|nr:hypothetical protein [Pseudofrankia saprophytica]
MLTSTAIARCRMIVVDTRVDWAALGYDDQTLDELVEFLLRIIQSMVIAPLERPRSRDELRGYLRRWLGPALYPGPVPATAAHTSPSHAGVPGRDTAPALLDQD